MRQITTRPNRYNDGIESIDLVVTGLTKTRFDQCHIGIIPEGREARKVFQGPLVPGPWGYSVTHANIIDNTGMAAADRASRETIAVGEPFILDGLPGVWCFRSPKQFEGDGAKLTEYEEAN